MRYSKKIILCLLVLLPVAKAVNFIPAVSAKSPTHAERASLNRPLNKTWLSDFNKKVPFINQALAADSQTMDGIPNNLTSQPWPDSNQSPDLNSSSSLAAQAATTNPDTQSQSQPLPAQNQYLQMADPPNNNLNPAISGSEVTEPTPTPSVPTKELAFNFSLPKINFGKQITNNQSEQPSAPPLLNVFEPFGQISPYQFSPMSSKMTKLLYELSLALFMLGLTLSLSGKKQLSVEWKRSQLPI
jgi:hypothetical protein